MIRSMTGFGRAAFSVRGAAFEVEVRCVNHRYLDLRARLPRALAAFEPAVRERIQAAFSRGKVELSVGSPEGGPRPELRIDEALAGRYAEAAARLAEAPGVRGPLPVGTLLTLPGVAAFAEPELSTEELERELLAAVEAALRAADAMRVAEGRALERELLERLQGVEGLARGLGGRAGEVQAAARERLRKRAEQLARETGLHDEARLHQEVVIAADRLDITEEIVRLESHVAQFRATVAAGAAGAPVGRRLDFLLQELGRETNTIGSKGSDAPIAHAIVELKAELERIREQVQNVE